MSEFRVDTITDRNGTGSPNFPNGLTLNGSVPVTNSPTWSETGTAASALATQSRIDAYNKGGKNLVINGNMMIHQRSGTTVPGISISTYNTADRWLTDASTAATSAVFSQLVDTTDFPANTEFVKSLRTTCTTSKTPLAAGDYVKIVQKIEGQNLQALKKGTSNAESITVSFWVKSNLTGVFICELDDIQNSRQISKSYTINSANTWEFETLTFPGDTSGTLTNDNAARFQISFWVAAGATYTNGTNLNSTAWASYDNGKRAFGMTNNLASAANTNNFLITGIQMEIGSIANPYEYKSYSEQLSLCQRYYNVINYISGNGLLVEGYGGTSNPIMSIYSYPVRMRAVPVISQTGTFSTSNVASYDFNTFKTDSACSLRAAVSTTGFAFFFMNSVDDSIIFNAELT